jgi:hypothetical protein
MALSAALDGGERAPATRLPWRWRIAALLAVIAAGALLALVVAHWGWRWLGPASPVAFPERKVDASAQEIVAAAPFGRAPPNAASAPGSPAAAAAATLPADTRLLGVYAGAAGSGYALLRLPDRGPVLVRSGQDIVAGVTLEAVRPDGIRIRDRGASRDLLLRHQTPGAGSASPVGGASAPQPASSPVAAPSGVRPVSARAAPVRAACMSPPGYTGPVYKLNAELLSGMAAQPQSWAALLEPGPKGLVVRENNGLAAMLGMKAGDRFVQANGIALTAIDDVFAGIVKPLVASQPVRLTGTRDGKPREWLFLNAGACPV